MTAPVEETTPTPVPAPTGTTKFYTQEELDAERERVREEEKRKLYGTIEKTDAKAQAMEAELRELTNWRKKAEKEEAARLKAIEDAQKAKEEAELSAKDLVAKRDQEFNARIAQLQADNEARVAAMEMELRFSQLQAYIQRRLAEESATIVPELMDFVTGNTPEEVEASIELMKTKSAAIGESARNARLNQQRSLPGVSPSAGTNGVTPLDQPGDRQYGADEIRGMSMQEFAALRKKINMPSGSGRGLFD